MTPIALLILISFIICLILYFAFSGPREAWDPDLESGTLSILGRRKDKLLRVLKDLDEERGMGSIEEAEYLNLRRDYKAKAVVALREFNRVQETRLQKLRSGNTHISADIREQIEKKVTRRLKALSVNKEGG